jgi:hypothetical protein
MVNKFIRLGVALSLLVSGVIILLQSKDHSILYFGLGTLLVTSD